MIQNGIDSYRREQAYAASAGHTGPLPPADYLNWLRVFEGRRIWLEAASVPGFRRSAERCAQKNCPIRANPNYDEIALPVPTFGHSGLPAIGLTPNSARQQKSEDWGGLQLK